MDAAPTTIRKPLYLTGERGCTVHADRVALRIFVEVRVVRRLPFGRISRIISRRDVEWTTQAILACTVNHIPIFFTDGFGQMLGCLLPARSLEHGLHETLGEFFDLAKGRHIYENWLRSEKSRLWRELYREPRPRHLKLKQGKIADDLEFRRVVYQSEELLPLPFLVREALQSCMVSLLCSEVVALHYEDGSGHRIDFLEDVVRLAALYYSLCVPISAARSANKNNNDQRGMLALFHHHEFKITSYVHSALHRLYRLARDTLESW